MLCTPPSSHCFNTQVIRLVTWLYVQCTHMQSTNPLSPFKSLYIMPLTNTHNWGEPEQAPTQTVRLCAKCIMYHYGRLRTSVTRAPLHTLYRVYKVCIKHVRHRYRVHTSLNQQKLGNWEQNTSTLARGRVRWNSRTMGMKVDEKKKESRDIKNYIASPFEL